jgi:hypothetical protein
MAVQTSPDQNGSVLPGQHAPVGVTKETPPPAATLPPILPVPDYPPPAPPVQTGLSRQGKWIVGIVLAIFSAMVLLGGAVAAWQIKSIDIPFVSEGNSAASVTAVSANQVEQTFTALRAQRAANVAGGGTTIAINSESCTITSPGSAFCTEQLTLSSAFSKQQQSLAWNVSYDPTTAEILNYTK